MKNYEKKLYGRKGFNGRRRMRQRRTKRRTPAIDNSKMIIYKSPYNAILPREYYCKLRSHYDMSLSVAGFTTGHYPVFPVAANDAYRPFGNFPSINVTYLDGISPLIRTSTDLGVLCNLQHYLRFQVLSTKTIIKSSTSPLVSDMIAISITPSITSPGTVPATLSSAMAQPYTCYKEFAGTNLGGRKLVCYTDHAQFLGIDKRIFRNDEALAFSGSYNGSPSTNVFHVINVQTLDLINPTLAVPIQVEVEQWVRFFDFTSGQVVT